MYTSISQDIVGLIIQASVEDEVINDRDREQDLSRYAHINRAFREAVRHWRFREIVFEHERGCAGFIQLLLSDGTGGLASHIRSLRVLPLYVYNSNKSDGNHKDDDDQYPLENTSWPSLSSVTDLVSHLHQLDTLTLENMHLGTKQIAELTAGGAPGSLTRVHLYGCRVASLRCLVKLLDHYRASSTNIVSAFEFLNFSTCTITPNDAEDNLNFSHAQSSASPGTATTVFKVLKLGFIVSAQHSMGTIPQWFVERRYSRAAQTLELRVDSASLATSIWPLVEDAAPLVKDLTFIFNGAALAEKHTGPPVADPIARYPSLTTLSIHVTRSTSFGATIGVLRRLIPTSAPALHTLDLNLYLQMDDLIPYDALPWHELDTILHEACHLLDEVQLMVWYEEVEDAFETAAPEPSEDDIRRMLPRTEASQILSVRTARMDLPDEFSPSLFD